MWINFRKRPFSLHFTVNFFPLQINRNFDKVKYNPTRTSIVFTKNKNRKLETRVVHFLLIPDDKNELSVLVSSLYDFERNFLRIVLSLVLKMRKFVVKKFSYKTLASCYEVETRNVALVLSAEIFWGYKVRGFGIVNLHWWLSNRSYRAGKRV